MEDVATSESQTSPRVFLSYANEDRPLAKRLEKALSGLDVEVISDQAIPPGASVAEYLRQGIETADGVLLLLTPASEHSSWVSGEVALALSARSRDASKTIIPILTSGTSELPPLLFDVQALLWEPDATSAEYAARKIAEALHKPAGAPTSDATWDLLAARKQVLVEAEQRLWGETKRQELLLRRTGSLTVVILIVLAMLSAVVLALNNQWWASSLVAATTSALVGTTTAIAWRHGRDQ